MLNTRFYRTLIWIILVALMLPASVAQASSPKQATQLSCPPYSHEVAKDETLLRGLSPECRKAYRQETLSNQQSIIQTSLLSVGGPDDFGYTFNDAVGYSWISASINSGLVGDDDFSSIDIGFNFPFYGITQTQLYFSTNGLISFGEGRWDWGGGFIPSVALPDNFIAPFWEDLLVGDVYNTGAIYYQQFGSAPNRYFVVEWRNVETYSGSSPFSFEAILYENGDIVFQHQSLPAEYYTTLGIENSLGDDGLQYQAGSSGLSAPKAIRFYYPTTSTARVLVSPLDAGQLSVPGQINDFTIVVSNTGSQGIDTYDLTTSSAWPVNLYAANGTTLLSDTDADSVIDTGPIAQGASTTVVAKFAAPGNAQVGDTNIATVTATSSLNPAKAKASNLSMSVPAGFVNVFRGSNGAMSFMTAHPNETNTTDVTDPFYNGYGLATTRSPSGNYFYAWTKSYDNGNTFVRDIEYVLLDRNGTVILPKTKLTNNVNATLYTTDSAPSIAIAPNGTIGVVWNHYVYDYSTNASNANIYMATLSSSGSLLTGPTNITNNAAWDDGIVQNVPYFFDPTIAATSDDRFILGWGDERWVGGSSYLDNIWYAVRNTAGGSVLPPTALTSDDISRSPVLNSLTDGRAILTWATYMGGGPYYAVINSTGSIFKATTPLGDGTFNWTADAVQLPNGKVAVASVSDVGIQLTILNSSYNIESGPTEAYNPSTALWDFISVTSDSSNHVIMTWNADNKLFYALGDSTSTFVTNPMIYRVAADYIQISENGQGNAPYSVYTFNDVPTSYWAWSYVERLSAAGITGGCGSGNYCPETIVNRAQMAVFLEKGIHGSSYVPPAVGAGTGFSDVPANYWAAVWIKQLAFDGITGGCGPGTYCPEYPVTRDQMAVFLLKSKHGSSYAPPAIGPAGTGFADVPASYWAAAWIKQLAAEGITGGCGNGNYCPTTQVTRAQMAVFLVKTFNLP